MTHTYIYMYMNMNMYMKNHSKRCQERQGNNNKTEKQSNTAKQKGKATQKSNLTQQKGKQFARNIKNWLPQVGIDCI